MKKPNAHNIKSRFRCRCGKLIKLNLADRKLHQESLLCYACWKREEAKRGHRIG